MDEESKASSLSILNSVSSVRTDEGKSSAKDSEFRPGRKSKSALKREKLRRREGQLQEALHKLTEKLEEEGNSVEESLPPAAPPEVPGRVAEMNFGRDSILTNDVVDSPITENSVGSRSHASKGNRSVSSQLLLEMREELESATHQAAESRRLFYEVQKKAESERALMVEERMRFARETAEMNEMRRYYQQLQIQQDNILAKAVSREEAAEFEKREVSRAQTPIYEVRSQIQERVSGENVKSRDFCGLQEGRGQSCRGWEI